MQYSLSQLDTIIFDLGEVIVDLDGQAVIDAFHHLTDGRGGNLRELMIGSPFLFAYETGKMTDQAFIREINQLFDAQISDHDFRQAWNLMIKGISTKRLELMEQLMKTHKVLILSNTNAMHEQYFDQLVSKQTGKLMKDYAHTAYYSHHIGYRKPNYDIYEYIVEEQQLDPARSLFLDDKAENIEAARDVGLHATQVAYPDQIFELLKYD